VNRRSQISPPQLVRRSSSRSMKPPPPPLVRLEDVTYYYPAPERSQSVVADTRPAIDGISADFYRGEYIALLGHNGSGKSTLARLINALYLPNSGRVLVDGRDTRQPSARGSIRELVGMIFSDPDNQIIATVVEDDIAWGPAARGWPLAQIHRRVDLALAAVGLEQVRTEPPSLLSGGQRQRLAIAGILALEPDCIVADEPTAQLDPLARRETVELLHELCRTRGLTIIHATHLLEEAALSDRVMILDHGRIALSGTPAEVFTDLERLRSLRLNLPDVALLGEELRIAGIPVPFGTLTPEALLSALHAIHSRQAGRERN
jgi:energy-coupling factor transport system ATP-binding protein